MRRLSVTLALFGFAAALIFTRMFPPVVGLGTTVRLPVFHGALTWANLVLFGLMALVGAVAVLRQTELWYRWSRALRLTAVGLWLAGSVLGLIAASITWDFTAAGQSPLLLLMQEPRMRLQFAVALMGLAVLFVPVVVQSPRAEALLDAIFATGVLTLLYFTMGQGSDLHPNSPVMNSGDPKMKLIFYGLFIAQLVLCSGIVAGVFATSDRPHRSE